MTGVTYSVSHYDVYRKSNDANIFEEVIDALMIEKYSNDEDITGYINSLDKSDKRMAILSLLDGDNNLWVKLKSLITEDTVNKMTHIKDVILMLRDFVKVGEVEKKKFGEVMTPLSLVKEMLMTLPKDVWENPDLKWLDPANGTGPFPVMVIYKLMKGLEKWEPDPEKRYKHILENMIYTCELQARNVFLWLCAVDPNDEYVTNTYWGSFLEDGFDKHMKEVWGVEKFDIVMCNPPYQIRKEGYKKTQPLWHLFVQKSLTLLEEDAYMVMVHPSGWRSVDGIFKETQKKLIKKLLHLEMFTEKDGDEIFGATTSFDFYLFKNSNNKLKTNIKLKTGDLIKIDLSNMEFIPTDNFNLFNKLLSNGGEKVNIIHSYSSYETRKSWTSRDKNEEFKFPCVYTITKDGTINKFYSSVNDKGHFGTPKVIWSNGMATTPTVDVDGEYGLTQFSYAIVDDVSNLEKIKEAMFSEKFNNLMKSCYMSSGNKYDRKVLSLFKKDFWKEFI